MLALALAVLLLSGCAGLPPRGEPPATQALPQYRETTLGRLAATTAVHPRLSGFRLLVSGEDALGALIDLADHAEKTLDLQYYLIHNDESTRAILKHVTAAADRGVRVRFLLDDVHTAGEDHNLLHLAEHPNIEVRLFNPFPVGRFSMVTRVFGSLTDVTRINHRMHSKMFVADNAVAVTGGRNLGDPYYVRSPTSNFLDLDVLAAGPVVRQLSASFDEFWNSRLAYPVEVLVDRTLSPPEGSLALVAPPGTPEPERNTALRDELRAGGLALTWVPATVIADKPGKIVSEGDPELEQTMTDDVIALMAEAQREIIVISPYYVPGERGIKLTEALRERGVRLRVLTNSLAATDAPAVHIGYSRYREALLRQGVELHELQPKLGVPRSKKLGAFGSSRASLHVKAMVIDRRTVLVGSMNMDPRSANLNSEIGLVLRSPALAEQLARIYDEVTLHSSYRLGLAEGDRLKWTKEAPEDREEHFSEPEASRWLRLMLLLLTPFAPEEML
ncbi:phospholipase D-like domain-containing protein [Caldimonas brevitalea]|uniref:Cardiolipin synthetase n=1 Tax=Caldimonas brevitalea TaxID=413882 RepID=A0A0G3BLY4_9BURK|nr:phospholipase D family protein [Caldimonas brevitalea]AKJ28366.1 cardiolipin synthetase [Caldimonas brevitalea]